METFSGKLLHGVRGTMLLICLTFASQMGAKTTVTETTDDFSSATTMSDYTNETPHDYAGAQTIWHVYNGGASNISAVSNAFGSGQIAIGMQYNTSGTVKYGYMTSDYIKGLKALKCRMAGSTTSVYPTWYYSLDGTTWVSMYTTTTMKVTNAGTYTITLPQEVLNAKGVYLKLAITTAASGNRLYVDDIYMQTEVESGCTNCFQYKQ